MPVGIFIFIGLAENAGLKLAGRLLPLVGIASVVLSRLLFAPEFIFIGLAELAGLKLAGRLLRDEVVPNI